MSKRSATREKRALNGEASLPNVRGSSEPKKEHRFSLKDAFRSAAIGCAIIGLDGRWLEVNERITDLLGYSGAELLGMTFDQALYREDLPKILEARKRLLSGQIDHFSLEVWCELHFALLCATENFPDAAQTRFVLHVTEITQRKHIEALLYDSEQRLSLALEGTGMAWWEHDRRLDVHLSSPNLEALLGFAPGTYPDSFEVFLEMVHPDDRPMIVEMNRNPETWRAFFEYRIRQPDGEQRWLSSRSRPIAGIDGAIERVIGVTTDVTERVQRERDLLQTRERLELALQSAAMGWWEWDVINDRHRWSVSFEQLLGFEPGTYSGTPEAFRQRLHPEDNAAFELMLSNPNAWREDWDYRAILADGSERWISSRSRVFWSANGSLERITGVDVDISARKYAEADLLRRATHDSLTDLPNRRTFTERLEHSLQMARRSGVPLAVAFLDLDRFKIVNDSLGHFVGDQLLVAIAQRLKQHLRQVDTLARLGGDEFAILLTQIIDPDSTIQFADQILGAFIEPFTLEDHQVFINVSIGIALGKATYDKPEHLLRDADTAMYHAKAAGKAQYRLFEATMHRAALALLQIETDLRRAISQQEFSLHYQPIVALDSGKIAGLEALIRWNHPDLGFIPPSSFIPVAEETGLIGEIGSWVLKEACDQIRTWQKQGVIDSSFSVSVNLSARQFAQINLMQQITQILVDTDLSPHCLKLEVTESAIMDNPRSAADILSKLRQQHIQLSMDDFGTGYSSLSYLQSFPMDYLKIDRSFVMCLDGTEAQLGLVPIIVKIAQTMNMQVVAEGIETPEQLAQLRSLNCDFGQGYFFSKPLTAEKVVELIKSGCQW